VFPQLQQCPRNTPHCQLKRPFAAQQQDPPAGWWASGPSHPASLLFACTESQPSLGVPHVFCLKSHQNVQILSVPRSTTATPCPSFSLKIGVFWSAPLSASCRRLETCIPQTGATPNRATPAHQAAPKLQATVFPGLVSNTALPAHTAFT